jgi:hypothetical protein
MRKARDKKFARNPLAGFLRKFRRLIEKGNLSVRSHKEESWREALSVLTSALSGIGLSFFGLSLSYYVMENKSTGLEISSHAGLLYLTTGLSLFVFIIAGVGGILRHLNRDVLIFKRRLGRVYLSALKGSALNPKSKPDLSHE